MLLPALGSLDLLVPLGGTSNHFKAEKLKKMGSWDPFNVTEDLDLGIVIKRSGGLVKVINSVTWEEANARLGIVKKGGWIPQRSRWIKGHMQAYLTHMRNPFKLLRDLGIKNFLVFQLIVGGTPAALLLSPVFLMVTVFYTLVRSFLAPVNPEVAHIIQIGIESIFPPAIFYLGMIVFILGNFMLVYYLLIGCLIRELYSNVKWMILAPLYWLLMSIATWKAFWQMFTKPHYWEKSEHGPVNKVQEVHTSIVVQPVLVEE